MAEHSANSMTKQSECLAHKPRQILKAGVIEGLLREVTLWLFLSMIVAVLLPWKGGTQISVLIGILIGKLLYVCRDEACKNRQDPKIVHSNSSYYSEPNLFISSLR